MFLITVNAYFSIGGINEPGYKWNLKWKDIKQVAKERSLCCHKKVDSPGVPLQHRNEPQSRSNHKNNTKNPIGKSHDK
ncbi:unnamed protein product [Moneuplotes crassus]|uniref:Uncharacterized protein n=1 Tax=Euplotes crassus TaxID=5936 RepID=A0AAD2D484_EUPCR|nr:unnamed protein product [Moneuplotes crassus]